MLNLQKSVYFLFIFCRCPLLTRSTDLSLGIKIRSCCCRWRCCCRRCWIKARLRRRSMDREWFGIFISLFQNTVGESNETDHRWNWRVWNSIRHFLQLDTCEKGSRFTRKSPRLGWWESQALSSWNFFLIMSAFRNMDVPCLMFPFPSLLRTSLTLLYASISIKSRECIDNNMWSILSCVVWP